MPPSHHTCTCTPTHTDTRFLLLSLLLSLSLPLFVSCVQGSYHGEKSFSIFSHEKSVLRRPGAAAFDVPQRYAPYTADKEAFMKRMMVLQRLGLYKHWWYLLVGAGAAALIAIFVTKFGARLW